MFSTRRNRRHFGKILSNLEVLTDGFKLEQDNHNSQAENRANLTGAIVTSRDTNHSIPAFGSQVDAQPIDRGIPDRLRSDVDNAVVTVETRLHDANWLRVTVGYYLN